MNHSHILLLCVPDNSALSVVMVLYSWAPMIVLSAFLLYFFFHRELLLVFLVAGLGVTASINEAVLKQMVRQPRPAEACDSSFGMPSGHSVASLYLFTFCVLEVLVDFGDLNILRCRKLSPSLLPAVIPPSYNSRTPTSSASRSLQCLLVALVLLPVPYSRVYLNYHSETQVIVGSTLGVLYAISCFLALRSTYLTAIALSFPPRPWLLRLRARLKLENTLHHPCVLRVSALEMV